jgi:methionine-rich copper-binding protein CopC
MVLLCVGVERLLLLFFGAARGLFVLQGIAFACASVAVFATAPPEAPAWLRGAGVSALLLSGTFLVAGLLLIAARRWRGGDSSGGEPARLWSTLLGFSLIALPAVAAIAGSGLPPLWRTIAVQLEATGVWSGATRTDSFSGLVILPILLALFVPSLVTAAACFSVAFPLALLPLLAARRRLFPTLLAMGVICQAALVLAAWIAVDAVARLATPALAAMAASGDAEVLRVNDELDRALGILTRTALALVAPMLGMLAWLAFLRPSGAAAALFTAGRSAVSGEALAETPRAAAPSRPRIPLAPVPERQATAPPDVARGRLQTGVGGRLARLALGVLGTLMLVFGSADGLRTRAFYVRSQPAPGETLANVPAAVRVTFGAELDPASSLSITRLVVQPSAGDVPRNVQIELTRLAPDDPGSRTIEAVPSRLSTGLYRVTWRALPAGGGVHRHGSFSFGVGVPVPADTADIMHSLQDRDVNARGRRQTVLGGLLLLGLSALLLWLPPRRS